MRAVSGIHALTQGEADTLSTRFRLPRSRITVISNPLPPAFAEPRAGKAAAQDERHPLILFVGRVDDRKGVEHLLEAFASLERDPRFAGVELRIVGDTSDPYAEILRGRLKELNLSRASFEGGVDDAELKRLYGRASVVVLPSSYEAFGMVLIEAMAMDCPVIATRVGGIPWIVAEGENGLLFDYGKVPELVHALERVLTDRALADKLREGGRRTVARFSLETVARRMEAFYRRAVGSA
jgi:glycosyltransferase involved in cell wall biosynthesis